VVVDDSDRERTIGELREHFALGRLTPDDLSRRVQRALQARSRFELKTVLLGLPGGPDDLRAHGRAALGSVGRGVALVLFTGAYLFFSFTLVVVLAVTLLVHGASAAALLAILAVWLVPTYLLFRFWHSARPWQWGRPRP
jgi:hypothetical protein